MKTFDILKLFPKIKLTWNIMIKKFIVKDENGNMLGVGTTQSEAWENAFNNLPVKDKTKILLKE